MSWGDAGIVEPCFDERPKGRAALLGNRAVSAAEAGAAAAAQWTASLTAFAC